MVSAIEAGCDPATILPLRTKRAHGMTVVAVGLNWCGRAHTFSGDLGRSASLLRIRSSGIFGM
jgi:hypothetical protein